MSSILSNRALRSAMVVSLLPDIKLILLIALRSGSARLSEDAIRRCGRTIDSARCQSELEILPTLARRSAWRRAARCRRDAWLESAPALPRKEKAEAGSFRGVPQQPS